MKDFNIAKYLKENNLGSHSILGAYVDLHALKEEEVGNNKPVSKVPYDGADKKLDGFGDEFDQVDPVEEMEYDDDRDDVDPLPSLSPKYTGDSESDDPDADIVNDFVQGMRPYYKKDPSFIKKVIDALRGKGTGAKMYDAGFRLNENEVEEIYDNSEQDKFDRMMGLAHEYFEKVSPIVRKTIDALRADGFDDQDIMDFLATDFTLEEEVSVSSSGVEMKEVAKDEFSNVINILNGISKKVKPTGAKLSFDDDSSSDAILVQVVTKDGDSKLQKAVHAEVKKLVQKANSGFKVSRIEQDSPGRISFSIDRVSKNMEEDINERMISYPSDMQIDGKVYDVDLGFKSFRAVYDADSEQFIFQYPDQGGRKSISKYDDSIKSVELHNPIKSPFTDPGYMNRD